MGTYTRARVGTHGLDKGREYQILGDFEDTH
jgi:hypothetical protein